jgi:hypothetical protein
MKTIRLYRNPGCAKCARLARIHHGLDWLNRFEDTTEVPPTGALSLGEIAVQDLASGKTLKGLECFRLLCKHVPAYWPGLLLLHFQPFRRYVEREVGGCGEASCELPQPLDAERRGR